MTEQVDQDAVHGMIEHLGPSIRNEVHLRMVLLKLEPDQQVLVYNAIKKHLKFKVRPFRKLMPKSVN